MNKITIVKIPESLQVQVKAVNNGTTFYGAAFLSGGWITKYDVIRLAKESVGDFAVMYDKVIPGMMPDEVVFNLVWPDGGEDFLAAGCLRDIPDEGGEAISLYDLADKVMRVLASQYAR